MSRFSIEENYDWKAERAEKKPVSFICNQCIHAYVSVVARAQDRNWSDLFVVSDYDRNSVIWRIPFSTFIQLFETTAKDWPASYAIVYDENLGDYRVTTD